MTFTFKRQDHLGIARPYAYRVFKEGTFLGWTALDNRGQWVLAVPRVGVLYGRAQSSRKNAALYLNGYHAGLQNL